jgi:cobalamin-dependent methionine synthase I
MAAVTSFAEALADRVHELIRQRDEARNERNRQHRRAELWKQKYQHVVRSRDYQNALRRWAKENRP